MKGKFVKKDLLCEEFEECVLCGNLTDIPKTLPIKFRKNYEIGVGQLCDDCSFRLSEIALHEDSIP